MPIPKNALTTNRAARAARGWYRQGVRRAAREALIASRQLRGAPHAHTPDYLLIGAMKSGTTGLFEALTDHPAFGLPLMKEVHYFDRETLRAFAWYRSHFWGYDNPAQLWGEASPSYFDTSYVPERVATHLPDVKLVLILRDPIARAISHYHHSVDFGLEHRSLEDAFRSELELLSNGGWSSTQDYLHFGYLARSRYSSSLRRWLDLFPAERLLVLVAERRYEALAEAATFLAPSLAGKFRADDVRDANRRPYPVPDADHLRVAADFVRDDAEVLSDMLGWDAVPTEWTNLAALS